MRFICPVLCVFALILVPTITLGAGAQYHVLDGDSDGVSPFYQLRHLEGGLIENFELQAGPDGNPIALLKIGGALYVGRHDGLGEFDLSFVASQVGLAAFDIGENGEAHIVYEDIHAQSLCYANEADGGFRITTLIDPYVYVEFYPPTFDVAAVPSGGAIVVAHDPVTYNLTIFDDPQTPGDPYVERTSDLFTLQVGVNDAGEIHVVIGKGEAVPKLVHGIFNGEGWDSQTEIALPNTNLPAALEFDNEGSPVVAYLDSIFTASVAQLVEGEWTSRQAIRYFGMLLRVKLSISTPGNVVHVTADGMNAAWYANNATGEWMSEIALRSYGTSGAVGVSATTAYLNHAPHRRSEAPYDYYLLWRNGEHWVERYVRRPIDVDAPEVESFVGGDEKALVIIAKSNTTISAYSQLLLMYGDQGAWRRMIVYEGPEGIYDAALARAPQNSWHVVFNPSRVLKYARVTPQDVSTEQIAPWADRPSITVDPAGRPHVVYWDEEDRPVYAVRWGGEWHREIIGEGDFAYRGNPHARVAADGSIYVVIEYQNSAIHVFQRRLDGWRLEFTSEPWANFGDVETDASGAVHMVYDVHRELHYVTNKGGKWFTKTWTTLSGFRSADILVKPGGVDLAVAWTDSGDGWIFTRIPDLSDDWQVEYVPISTGGAVDAALTLELDGRLYALFNGDRAMWMATIDFE
ncbi:MAG: hypothetical protein P9L99_15925 [Candidatus Lernaella stagnicola]|nr:hypothetical protein [Candidatus Lernaella stagnicola]